MIPDCQRKLKDAHAKLSSLLEECHELHESKEYTEAKEQVEATQSIVSAQCILVYNIYQLNSDYVAVRISTFIYMYVTAQMSSYKANQFYLFVCLSFIDSIRFYCFPFSRYCLL